MRDKNMIFYNVLKLAFFCFCLFGQYTHALPLNHLRKRDLLGKLNEIEAELHTEIAKLSAAVDKSKKANANKAASKKVKTKNNTAAAPTATGANNANTVASGTSAAPVSTASVKAGLQADGTFIIAK
jgi:peptidoglycan hydrolase CwlO-like protein